VFVKLAITWTQSVDKQFRHNKSKAATCFGSVILFLHFLIHTTWWRLFYVAETCSCFGCAV